MPFTYRSREYTVLEWGMDLMLIKLLRGTFTNDQRTYNEYLGLFIEEFTI